MSDEAKSGTSLMAVSENHHLERRSSKLVRRGLDHIARIGSQSPSTTPIKYGAAHLSETEITHRLEKFAEFLDDVEVQASRDKSWKARRASDPLYQQLSYQQRKANRLSLYEIFLRKGMQGLQEHFELVRSTAEVGEAFSALNRAVGRRYPFDNDLSLVARARALEHERQCDIAGDLLRQSKTPDEKKRDR